MSIVTATPAFRTPTTCPLPCNARPEAAGFAVETPDEIAERDDSRRCEEAAADNGHAPYFDELDRFVRDFARYHNLPDETDPAPVFSDEPGQLAAAVEKLIAV